MTSPGESQQLDYDEIYAQCHQWLTDNWNPDLTVRQWWANLADSGWGFPTWPKEWFGRGLGAEALQPVRAAFQEVGALPPPAGIGQGLGGPTILTHGTEEQKALFLPPLARGEEMWCQFFSEPGSGSDLASAQTRAVRDGDRYIVNGQKVWTSGAQWADRGVLVSRTDPEVPKHRGITYFVIDIDQPGIEIRPLHQMNDDHGFNEVFFTDAVVGADRIITEENAGWAVAVTTLMFERFGGAMPSARPGKRSPYLDKRAGDVVVDLRRAGGGARGTTDLAPLLTEIAQDKGANTDPNVRDGLAKLKTLEEIDRYATLRQANSVKSGTRPPSTGSVRKLNRSDLARLRSQVGMSLLGANGMLVGPDTPGGGEVQYVALSAPSRSIAGGTDEIQKGIIGERVLGLPKEPRIDRDIVFRDLQIGTQRSA